MKSVPTVLSFSMLLNFNTAPLRDSRTDQLTFKRVGPAQYKRYSRLCPLVHYVSTSILFNRTKLSGCKVAL